ncbi:MAG: hypothetical protein QOI83_778, partial [Streptomycetaceae bacterium]|nr:hypothetical protein [Streptomycetaceae bacterium]
LVTVLSETNLRANKDQLLSSGIRVRLRRKSTWQAHDVQILVKGTIDEIKYLGDTDNWLVRSSSGVSSSGQSGRSSARGIGVRAAAQVTLLPKALSTGFAAEGHLRGSRRNQAGPTARTDSLNSGATKTSSFGTTLDFGVDVTMTTRARTAKRALTPGSPGRDEAEAKPIASTYDTAENNPLRLDPTDVTLTSPAALTLDSATKNQLDAHPRSDVQAPAPFPVAGIGDLTSQIRLPGVRTAIREWDFVETVGDGQPIRDLAFKVLAEAAGRNRALKKDSAFEAEGLAPRLAIEDQLSPQAITAALRQGVTSSWVVTNLRYPRRLAALTGAVGTRFALTAPHVMPSTTGAGMENMALGGHQVAGQRGKAKTKGASVNAAGTEHGANWSLGESIAPHRALTTATTETAVLSGTVERNAVTPRDKPLFLVQCNLVVAMTAEVKVNTGGPYVASALQTLPGAVSLWLTEEQLKAAGLRDPDAAPEVPETAKGKQPATAAADAAGPSHARQTTDGPETAGSSAAGASTAGAARPLPLTLAQGLPLGVGLIENLPDFVPLLGLLRAKIRDRSLAKELLPQQQLSDPNDNVQRLLRVLDRDGATGLLAGAMDGGVPVELFRGRKTPYWAVFHVDRKGPGTVTGPTSGREMEYATVAVAQSTTTRAESDTSGIDASVTATGQLKDSSIGSSGGTAGVGVGKSASTKQAVAGRGQIGLRTIVDGAAPAVKVKVPIEASLKLYSADGEVASAELGGTDQHLVYRALDKDLRALRQLRPVDGKRGPGQNLWSPVAGAAPEELRTWRETGAQLPMAAQVNGFRGAPDLQAAIHRTMTDAQASGKFHSKGNAAAYAQREAVSTEWLIAALPLLVSAGVELPANHASGLEGQDLGCSLHARLFDGHVLEALDDQGGHLDGDEMTFETVAQSTLDAPRPSATGHPHSASHGTSVQSGGGEGPVRADYSGMNNVVGTGNFTGSATSSADNGSGTVPLQKPRDKSALVQFTLEFRIVARVHHRHTQRVRSASGSTSVQDYVLPTPVVIRMPELAVRQMLKGPRKRAFAASQDRALESRGPSAETPEAPA